MGREILDKRILSFCILLWSQYEQHEIMGTRGDDETPIVLRELGKGQHPSFRESWPRPVAHGVGGAQERETPWVKRTGVLQERGHLSLPLCHQLG